MPQTLIDVAEGPRVVDELGFRAAYWLRAARARGDVPGDDALASRSATAGGLFVLADGVGSDSGGREAARGVVSRLVEGELQPDFHRTIQSKLESIHLHLRRDRALGSSTVVAAAIEGDQLRLAHCGDSGAALISRGGELLYRTLGHGPAHYAIAAGELEPSQILEHDEHHIVTNVVGSDPLVVEWAGPMRMRKSDTLVLASDGVLDNLEWESVAPLVARGSLMTAAQQLAAQVEASIDAGGKDDDRCFWLIRRS
jgi:serine/threonine protein phosphatase PrpC